MVSNISIGRIPSFLKEVKAELGKVTWLNRKQTVHLTLIVIAVSMAVASFIASLDFVFAELMKILI